MTHQVRWVGGPAGPVATTSTFSAARGVLPAHGFEQPTKSTTPKLNLADTQPIECSGENPQKDNLLGSQQAATSLLTSPEHSLPDNRSEAPTAIRSKIGRAARTTSGKHPYRSTNEYSISISVSSPVKASKPKSKRPKVSPAINKECAEMPTQHCKNDERPGIPQPTRVKPPPGSHSEEERPKASYAELAGLAIEGLEASDRLSTVRTVSSHSLYRPLHGPGRKQTPRNEVLPKKWAASPPQSDMTDSNNHFCMPG
jgi:hypothetical protein